MAENRYTKAARAAMLAEKHPQVEEFEAAGGDVGALPKIHAVIDGYPHTVPDEANLYLPSKEDLSLDSIDVIRSLKGGETPDQALTTAKQGLVDAERRKERVYDANRRDWEEKIYPALSDLMGGSGVYPGQYHELGKLQEMGLIKMSPELEKLVGSAIKRRTDDSEEFFKVDEIKNLIEDLKQFNRDNTPFEQRAREFQKKNPGKPYREEGKDE